MTNEMVFERNDPLADLSTRSRITWARDVLRQRVALAAGLAVSGPWMVRRAEAILAAGCAE